MLRVFGHAVPKSVILLAFVEALAIYFALAALATIFVKSYSGPAGFTAAAVAPTLAIVVVMIALGVYEPNARARLSIASERMALAALVGAVLSFIYVYFVRAPIWYPPLYVIAAAASAYGAVVGLRFIASRIARLGEFQRRVMVLGEGEPAELAVAALNRPAADAALVGRITSSVAARGDRLFELAQKLDVAEIVVAQPRGGALPVRGLLDCKAAGIRITDFVAFHERETGKLDVSALYPARLIFAESIGFSSTSLMLKRGADILLSGIGILLTAPLTLGAAIAIKREDGGPILYRQTRVGLNGKPFEIFKFRSMRTDAEKFGAQWAAENDPRVTRVGRFLRDKRIDELPQLFNILRGDMSLVGPRPERPIFVERLAEEIPFYNERHRAKPGLTGWAQINYRYGATDEDAREKLQYDLYYLKNRSLFLDLTIVLTTMRVVLWPDEVR